jgi:murein L,D-transpeptidase YcbB/YkuD
VVNVPEFMLHTYQMNDKVEANRDQRCVIVGNARKTRTPLFDAEMQPRRIQSVLERSRRRSARGETLPRLRSDPGYFERQGFELVTSDGRVLGSLPEGGLDALAQGRMRIRQKPGARNALGDIKFVFPNADNIYLHHTPTAQLFKRDRRDFSHGCIRVEAPADLAEFVFAGEPEWTRNASFRQ